MNWELIYRELPNLSRGCLYTIWVTFISLSIGGILGLILAILKLSRFAPLRLAATAYVEAFRGTPMFVQILAFYYAIFPLIGFERTPAMYAGITALSLNSAAYMCEIFRGGIMSVDKGQTEAAVSLGLTKWQSLRYVVLPQGISNSLPAIGNEFVILIKDSSLVSAITVPELTQRAMLVASRNWAYPSMFFAIAAMYFIMTFTTSRILARLEKRLRAGEAR